MATRTSFFPLDGGRMQRLGNLLPSRSWMGVISPNTQHHPHPTCASEQARKLRYPSPIKGEGQAWVSA